MDSSPKSEHWFVQYCKSSSEVNQVLNIYTNEDLFVMPVFLKILTISGKLVKGGGGYFLVLL